MVMVVYLHVEVNIAPAITKLFNMLIASGKDWHPFQRKVTILTRKFIVQFLFCQSSPKF